MTVITAIFRNGPMDGVKMVIPDASYDLVFPLLNESPLSEAEQDAEMTEVSFQTVRYRLAHKGLVATYVYQDIR